MRACFIAFLLLGPLSAAAAQSTQKTPEAKPPPPPKTTFKGYKRKPINRNDYKISGKPKHPGGFVVQPKTGAPNQASMILRPHGAKAGVLLLEFKVLDANMELSRRGGFVAQLFSDEEVTVTPDIVTNTEWPKNDRLEIHYKVAKPGGPYQVQGEAAYTLCHKKTHVCENRQTAFHTYVK